MRIAIFSDLHGNSYACQAALQAMRREGKLDALVAAGDICLGGSDPAACVERLAEVGAAGVFGNTEEYLYHPEQMPGDELHRGKWLTIQPAAFWTRERLSPAQFGWLQSLPFELRFSPTGRPEDDLLVVHANPKNVELMIYPDAGGQEKLWGQVRQTDDDQALAESMQGLTAGVLAFGHFHHTFQRRWREHLLVDVACCSLPSIDRDWRARYTLFTWRPQGWQVEPRWVEYDARLELEALLRSDMPNKETFARYFDR